MQLFLQGLTTTFCRACAAPVANPLPRYLRCHANCSWPALTLDSPRRRLLALWPFAAATACCKLLPVACRHCPISYRRHATILMSRKSLPHLYCQCIYDLPLPSCPCVWRDAPKFNLTLQPLKHQYLHVYHNYTVLILVLESGSM